MKYTKGEMIKMIIIGGGAVCLIFWLYYGFPLWICAAITVAVDIAFLISFRSEKKSEEKYRKTGESIRSGDYHRSDEWREKYAEFLEKKGFGRVKRSSMKADLTMRYLRPFGVFMMCLGAAVAFLGVLALSDDTGAGTVTMLTGIGFAVYGGFAVFPKNVRRFIKQCGERLPEINDSYMEGSILTYKRNATSESWNDGINIGERFVVVFTRSNITAIEREAVVTVKQNVHMIKYYGDGLYTGSEYAYNTDIYTRSGEVYRIRLGEFQSELVCETLCSFASAVERNLNKSEQHYDV